MQIEVQRNMSRTSDHVLDEKGLGGVGGGDKDKYNGHIQRRWHG